LTYIFAVDNMRLYVYYFSRNCLWHENRVWYEIDNQGHSRSIILIFAINYRPIRDYISTRNNADVISSFWNFKKLVLLVYILPLVVWVCLHSIFVEVSSVKCNVSAYRPFTLIQGHWFWYESKARIRLPISPS